jgi:Xaa-Pro aminopeptidase
MSETIYGKRISALREEMARKGIDTAWIIQPENRRYLSGFRAIDTLLTESSGSLFISGERCVLATDSRYTTEAAGEAKGFEVLTLKKGLAEAFPELMSNLSTRSLGFEEDYVTWGLHREVIKKVEAASLKVDFLPLDGMVGKMREVKDPSEIEALEASAGLISRILDDIIPHLEPGLTEKEVAWRIEVLSHEAGADGLAFPAIVASGPNGALPHAVPTDRKLEPGEPIIFDMGVRLEGYCSDMTRTHFLGEARKEFKEIYSIVREAQLAALEEVRPGVWSDHPDGSARQVIGKAGFGDYFGHSLGHGVGLATHEGPRLSPLKRVELKEGMVVTVEPGIYLPGKGGVRLEEMVVVEREGPRIITTNRHFYDFR